MEEPRSPFASGLRVYSQRGFAPLLAVLTFSLPSNLLAEYVLYFGYGPDDIAASIRISSLLGLIMIPLYASIMVRAANGSGAESRSMVGFLVRSSVEDWAHVFKARFIASLLVGLGFLALIVPGVILTLRYAFVEVLAIRENANGSEARKRSAELASGRYPKILRLFLSVLATTIVAMSLVILPSFLSPPVDNFVIAAVGDTLFDVVFATFFAGAWFIYEAAHFEAEPTDASPIGSPAGGPH